MFLAREDLTGLGGGGTDGRGRFANLGLMCMDLGGGNWCFWGLLGGLPLNLGLSKTLLGFTELMLHTGLDVEYEFAKFGLIWTLEDEEDEVENMGLI